jgi:hypothetical protein
MKLERTAPGIDIVLIWIKLAHVCYYESREIRLCAPTVQRSRSSGAQTMLHSPLRRTRIVDLAMTTMHTSNRM